MKLPVDYNKLTWQERKAVRLEYVKIQNELCAHCGTSLYGDPAKEVFSKPIKLSLFPPNFLMYPVHLHHNHNTGMTIGAVHSYCNAVLWEYHGE